MWAPTDKTQREVFRVNETMWRYGFYELYENRRTLSIGWDEWTEMLLKSSNIEE